MYWSSVQFTQVSRHAGWWLVASCIWFGGKQKQLGSAHTSLFIEYAPRRCTFELEAINNKRFLWLHSCGLLSGASRAHALGFSDGTQVTIERAAVGCLLRLRLHACG